MLTHKAACVRLLVLPFTPSEFFAVFARYNEAIWPAQFVFLGAAVAAVLALRRGGLTQSRGMLGLLALLWAWMAVGYHWTFFRVINPIASLFAVLFAAQAVVLAMAALQGTVRLMPRTDVAGITGSALVVLALVLYPLLGLAAGHRYPAMPTFGLPCPTTIFTLGVLLWAMPLRPHLLIVPLLWSLIGFTAALQLGVYEDIGLLVSAIASGVVILHSRRTRPQLRPS